VIPGSRLISGALIYIVSGTFQRASFLLFIPVLSRLLSKSEFGTYSFWISMYGIFQILLGLGMDASINRLYHDYDKNVMQKSKFLYSLLLSQWIILPVLGISCISISYIFLSSFLESIAIFPYLYIIVFAALFAKIFESVLAAYRTSQQPMPFLYLTLLIFLLLILTSYLFVVAFRWTSTGAILAILISNFIASIFSSWALLHRLIPSSIRLPIFVEALNYGFPTIFGKVGIWINSKSSTFIIAHALSTVYLATFQVASTSLTIIMLFCVSLSNAYVPWFYKHSVGLGKSSSSDRSIISNILLGDKVLILIYAIFSAMFFCFPVPFVALIAPLAEYNDAVRLVPLLAYSAFLFCQYSMFNKFLTFQKYTLSSSLVVLLPALFAIPLIQFATRNYGLVGTAVGTILIFLSSLLASCLFAATKVPLYSSIYSSLFPRLIVINSGSFATVLLSSFFVNNNSMDNHFILNLVIFLGYSIFAFLSIFSKPFLRFPRGQEAT